MTGVRWRRVAAIALFALLLFNWGCWETWHDSCNPLKVETCEWP